ncbi:MAG: sigma-70 family RNA polymerase sigma factor [Candidatus Hydrogenedentes bacterium]|nr:sigma-70 family RNA polymerase sigma factor [Candidatus Hydrogenedentota bacterium]
MAGHLTGKQTSEFLELVGKHRDEFYRYVLRTVWDSGTAEDTFQAALLAAYENFHRFTPGTNFRAWVYRIITNKCFVANRETARTPAPLDDVEPGLVAVGEQHGYGDVLKDPAAFLEQCGDEVNAAFKRLSTAERSCILLRGVERFSYQEIAEILEMPVGTVMTHLSRGRAKLRQDLLEYARENGIVRSFPRLVPREDQGEDERRERGTL